MLLILTIISVATAVLLLVRLWMIRRELGRMTGQLQGYNEQATGKKIDVALFDAKLEALAGQINRQSHLLLEAGAYRKVIENEFRQAVANISHDIRTPLTSIFGYIQLLESESITPEEKLEYVAIVKNRTKRLQALLNDFFELSVIESLDYPLTTEKLGMTSLLSDILVGFYDSFSERDIIPDIRLPDGNIFVYADESAVRRVVENLLVNTVKHATGQVEIIFKRQRETASLTIVNDAEELAGSDVSLLFDRFYTADRNRSAQASGLGLSIAKSLMIKMGGTLTAELNGVKLTMTCRWKLAAEAQI
ncbi:histidine kinase/DNA gyrase B/HSP90-like ATPase [Fontibacillus phaseoli]|uniref:histidine kinase n=1 Tax=Fontibacillus phaseoli TaxID=1416533 RepID=A0A369BUI6_9BACL|nr:HAMP domain-containing sensor histidine kinase [Fontibacillus phaseoli]RCX23274.1 histidine kinase/DNA gyrase B/HSP90-like ATPase [Fontibacillus phaseoli]